MSPETELRSRPSRAVPDVDAEQEVDLGRVWSSLVARWWLPLGGLAAGLVLGYLLSLGGSQTYHAQAVFSVGTPLAVGGGLLPSVQTNPSSVREVAFAESTIRRAAAASGLRPGQVRNGLSAAPISSGTTAVKAAGGTPLYQITVKGPQRKVGRAANELARVVINTISADYVDAKIATLRAHAKADQTQLALLNRRLAEERALLPGLTGAEKLAAVSIIGIAEQRRATVTNDLLSTQPLLTQAETVERGRILTPAVATKTTARSPRNSALVGTVIGLILGILAALLWQPLARSVARRPAV